MSDITENGNSYYFPAIEEFQIGFEVYHRDPDYQGQSDGKEWKKRVIDAYELCDIIESWEYNVGEYRVKHLDHDDIVECGWAHIHDNAYQIFSQVDTVWLRLIKHAGNRIDIHTVETPRITMYLGDVKNKSELKFIMTRLGITKD